MEAEKWAHAKMREHGVPVPRSMTQRAKDYVARKLNQAANRGAKKIDRKAIAFVGDKFKHETWFASEAWGIPVEVKSMAEAKKIPDVCNIRRVRGNESTCWYKTGGGKWIRN